jgi:hypothetical protein
MCCLFVVNSVKVINSRNAIVLSSGINTACEMLDDKLI